MAALRAWRELPSKGEAVLSLASVLQGPEEPLQNFVARLLLASERIINNTEASKLVVQQLAFENANKWCKEALRAHKRRGTLLDMIRICSDIGPSYVQGITLAAAVTQIIHPQPGGKGKNKAICFRCGNKGHPLRNCSATPIRAAQPLSVTKLRSPSTKCQHGYHWNNQCRSRTAGKSRPFLGNPHWRLPQPHQIMGAAQMAAVGKEVLGEFRYPACTPFCLFPYTQDAKGSHGWQLCGGEHPPTSFSSARLLSHMSPGFRPGPCRPSCHDVGVQVNQQCDASVQCMLGRQTPLCRVGDPGVAAAPRPYPLPLLCARLCVPTASLAAWRRPQRARRALWPQRRMRGHQGTHPHRQGTAGATGGSN
ncbi:PREDICTED: endogenous retrovirus group K member 24 Gag polyprotein-like [Chinchilla lanigera]|uniref:endogenous retrovirus group K member 24 Gag polyprotein-like n=1 Tax=Chinchilla lanigera TaxID=34839 RepID=UPI0006972224|nr:PREDICTED: endogenous retrovirus group K member 24 Gag polyprotein-like [Chinchilla lanigera]